MKLLYITPSFQHPKVRGPNRHYHFIRELAQRHAITLLTLERSPIAEEARREMAGYAEALYTFKVNGAPGVGMLKRLPGIGGQVAQQVAIRAAVQQMKQTFHRLLREQAFDLVLFHGKDCFSVIEKWRQLPIVTDFCDATSLRVQTKMRHVNPAQQPLLYLRYLQVRQLERRMIQSTPHVAFISLRDRAAILGAESKADVIPNGLDLAYWTRRTQQPKANSLIFTGVMDYSPNTDAALQLIDRIMPHLRRLIPQVEVIIAGRNPTPALVQRAEQYPDVKVTGFVDDMRDYLEQATVFAAPLRFGAGMQNKLQEALAMQVPIVTSPLGAEGLRITNDEMPPVHVADNDEQFAQKVAALLQNQPERQRLAIAGRRYAEKHFVWARSAAHLEQMCREAICKN